MKKQYETPNEEPLMLKEQNVAYGKTTTSLHLDIELDDTAVIADIEKAIKIIKGIASVSVSEKKSKKMSGIDKGLDDIKKGNVYHAKDSADLIKQIFG